MVRSMLLRGFDRECVDKIDAYMQKVSLVVIALCCLDHSFEHSKSRRNSSLWRFRSSQLLVIQSSPCRSEWSSFAAVFRILNLFNCLAVDCYGCHWYAPLGCLKRNVWLPRTASKRALQKRPFGLQLAKSNCLNVWNPIGNARRKCIKDH